MKAKKALPHVGIGFLTVLTTSCLIYASLIINWDLLKDWLAVFN